MAISREEIVAITAGGAVLAGAILLARRPLPAEPVEPLFAITGPSEATSREIIRAGVESQRIEATFERDIASIGTRGIVDLFGLSTRKEVDLARLDQQERIVTSELRTRETISAGEQLTRREIAKIAGDTQRFVAQSREDTQRAAIGAQQQKGLFDTILEAIPIIGGLFG